MDGLSATGHLADVDGGTAGGSLAPAFEFGVVDVVCDGLLAAELAGAVFGSVPTTADGLVDNGSDFSSPACRAVVDSRLASGEKVVDKAADASAMLVDTCVCRVAAVGDAVSEGAAVDGALSVVVARCVEIEVVKVEGGAAVPEGATVDGALVGVVGGRAEIEVAEVEGAFVVVNVVVAGKTFRYMS